MCNSPNYLSAVFLWLAQLHFPLTFSNVFFKFETMTQCLHVSLYSNDTCNCTCTSSVCYYWPVCSSNPRLKAAFCRLSAAVYLPIKCFVFYFPKRRRKCSDPTCSSFCFCHPSSLNLDTLYIRYVCVWGWIYTTSTLVFLEQYKPPHIFIKDKTDL